jgi:DNA-binding NtrC family response regulator
VAPLRERPEDIEPILEVLVARYAEVYRLPAVVFEEAAVDRLVRYPWPGNVRELENCVRYLTCLQLGRGAQPDDLPLLAGEEGDGGDQEPFVKRSLKEAKRELVARFERDYLEQALRASQGNIARAARSSGKARRAFFELMRKHGLTAAAYTSHAEAPDMSIGGGSDSPFSLTQM